MNKFILTLLISLAILSGIDYTMYINDVHETATSQTSETNSTAVEQVVWYPGKYLIVRPAIRLHNRIQNNRNNRTK